jgi:hypothetical protein
MNIMEYAVNPLAFLADLRLPVSGAPRFGDVWAPFQVAAFQALAPTLVAVSRGEKPPTSRFWMERTKGASKDSDLAACVLWLLAFARRPVLIQVAADDADQAAEIRKAAEAFVRVNEWLKSRIDCQAWKIVCGTTGSTCEIITSDATSSHGSRPDVVILNELSHVGSRDFAETVFDNLTKMTLGVGMVATNAGVIGSWQWDWREIARLSGRWWFQQVNEPALWLDAAAVEEAQRRNPPARFRRLFLGQWVTETEGDAIPEHQIQRALTLSGPLSADGEWFYGAGFDLGLRGDPAALVVVRARPGSKIQVASVQVWRPSEQAGGEVDVDQTIRPAILEAYRQYSFARLFVDPWQSIDLCQRLNRMGLPVTERPSSAPNKREEATALLECFAQHKIEVYPDADLVRDLRAASIRESSGLSGMRVEFPRNEYGHGDAGTALLLVLPAALATANSPPPSPDDDYVDFEPASPMFRFAMM